MGFKDLIEKAKNMVKDDHIDKAADFAKGKFGDKADLIDKAANAAKGANNDEGTPKDQA